jgi:aquaporin Z
MLQALRSHWPEYACEALGLGAFMVSACLFGALLEYPPSPVHRLLASPAERRLLMGLAMGATAIAIIYSPWGRRSGAHINPAVTLTFFRLGRIGRWDAFFYVVAQFVGGVAGVALSAVLVPMALADERVNYVVTVPGPQGWVVAAIAEAAISFGLMSVVLALSSDPRSEPYTGVVAGALVVAYIAIEAPYSGMSMNPARTAASAVVGRMWTAWWVYFVAPPAGMLLAAEAHVRRAGWARVACAKLRHDPRQRCIFCGAPPSNAPIAIPTNDPLQKGRLL